MRTVSHSPIVPFVWRLSPFLRFSNPQFVWAVDGCLNQPTDSVSVTCLAGTAASFSLYGTQDCTGSADFQGNSKTGACATASAFGSSYIVYCGTSPSPAPSASPAPAPQWSQAGYNAQHTSRSPYAGPKTPPKILWSFPVDYGQGSPAVGADGTVYFCTESALTALSGSSGKVLWTVQFACMGSPAIGLQGMVYVTTYSGLAAFNGVTGAQLWMFTPQNTKPQFYLSPVLDLESGTVYAATAYTLYALDGRTGDLLWLIRAEGEYEFQKAPAIGHDGLLYTCTDGWFCALDKGTGAVNWNISTTVCKKNNLLIGDDNTVYVTGGSTLYALNGSSGAQIWSTDVGSGNGYSGPGAIGRDAIYVSTDGMITAVGLRFGEVLWTRGASGGPFPAERISITVDVNGLLFFSWGGEYFTWNGTTGATVCNSSSNSSNIFYSDPLALGADGTLYFVTSDGGDAAYALK